jgi:arabinogalactan oligomer / maltooligosaccharide transport system permease protein
VAARGVATRPTFTVGLVVKLLFLAAVNGLAFVALPRIIEQRAWVALAAIAAATLLVDYVYLSKRRLPAKYLIPGTVFLVLFQLYPALYTFYISFTNYSTGHILTKEQALERILANSEQPLPDSPRYQARPLESDAGGIALLLIDADGNFLLGTAEVLEPLDPAEVETTPTGLPLSVRDFRVLTIGEAQGRQDEFLALRVPTEGGSIRLQTFTSATLGQQTLRYDAETDTVTNILTGEQFQPEEGQFVGESGELLNPGWRVVIGPDNYTKAFTSEAIRGPFFRAFIWNYVFAVLSVFFTFVVGLGLALTLAHPKLKGKRLYRTLLVIPYAIPSFLSALVWGGLLNREFGAVNRILGADIGWLSDPTLAKISVLLVNLWLGFPYMFLITIGALQSIPEELTEAAGVDGASPARIFRTIRLPLLLTSVAPLLISSFAFNFNNFNVIYLLTKGGPPIVGAQTPAGHTDILISYTYRLAFESGRGQDAAFATAIAVLIFLMVGTISAISFKFTRTLEQIR